MRMLIRACWATLLTIALLPLLATSNAQTTEQMPGTIVAPLPSPNTTPLAASPPTPGEAGVGTPTPLEGSGTFYQLLNDPNARVMPKPEAPKPSLTSVWDNGLNFVSEDKDWKIHVGGRVMFQPTFWIQPQNMKGNAPGNGGIPASKAGDGVGSLDDGAFFRRVRLRTDGTGYGVFEYVMEVDFEQLNQITFDHVWGGVKDIPFLGGASVRVGQHKVPQGLEMMGSDYHLVFLERSALAEAFWTLFAPGVFVSNDFFNKNVTVQTMFHRIQPLGFYNYDYGDGDYASTSRITYTPLYQNEGETVVHLGASYQWRHGDLGRTVPGGTGNKMADTQSVVRFRSRAELRDSVGLGTPVLGGDSARFIDTGFLLSSDVQTVSPEFLLIYGPLSFQAEGAGVYVNNVRSIYPTKALNKPQGDLTFWGGYAQVSYLLTGEHRGYERRFGTFDRTAVKSRFGPTKTADGNCPPEWGLGAWEVAYRYSYLDLDNKGINGGQLGQHTLGLNWYLNDNFKVQFNYLNIQREVIAPANSGTVHGFGFLTQFYF